MIKEKRVWELSYAISIVLVVLGHSNGVPSSYIPIIREKVWWYDIFQLLIEIVYTFHIPMFFFMSGYFLSRQENIMRFVYLRTKRLLVPYVILTIISFPIKYFFSDYADREINPDFYSFFNAIIYPWNNPIVFMWFLPTLFIISVLVYAFVFSTYADKKSNKIIALILIIILNFNFEHVNISGFWGVLNFGGVLHNLIYFYIGYYLKITLDSKLTYESYVIFGFIFIYMLVNSSFHEAILGMFALILLSCALVNSLKNKYLSSCVDILFKYGFQIYMLSWFFQMASRVVTYQILKLPVSLSVVLMFTAGIFGPVLFCIFINRMNGCAVKGFKFFLAIK